MYQYETDHLKRLRDHLGECTVLLKSDGQFPLSSPCPISLYGSGARHTVKGGTGSGEVNSRYFVNVEQGLQDAGFTITTGAWLDAYDEVLVKAHKQFIKDIHARARANHTLAVIEGMGATMPEPEYNISLQGNTETAIYVLARNSGEGNDRNPEKGDILLTDTEVRDILECNRRYSRFMLVLNIGGPVDLTPVMEVSNILVLSQLGVDTGTALADLLLGKTFPSGKLTTTWAAWQDYCNKGTFGDEDDTYYNEGVYVGYRYFDTVNVKPLFPFGYGLGYTTFSVSLVKVEKEKDRVSVTAKVTNNGNFAGKETVQLYLSSPSGELDKPYQALAAFAKTSTVANGSEEEVELSFSLSDLSSYSEKKAAYVLEHGDYILRLGNSSRDTFVCAVLKLDEDITVKKVKNVLGDPGLTEWKPEAAAAGEIPADCPVLNFTAEDFCTVTVDYDLPDPVDHAMGLLNDTELAHLGIGYYNPKGGLTSVIGEASPSVAGAAGETTHEIDLKEFPPIIMADGPAGLRLGKEFYRGKDGTLHTLGATMPQSVLEFMPFFIRPFLSSTKKLPKGAVLEEQYATAIPIGTAIAQSWNLEFAETCGDIVGSEMEMFHVDLWLAPALNIHRTIRCGRNFEYYSEDPLISGLFAAAITKGVQAHPGCGTTIKHYAANNQERNRYGNNSHVSERAMREIYLRGFELCIRESDPAALMSSYNLLNGTHTSEHTGLCVDILRREWGYEGVVMTDWVVAGMTKKGAKYPVANSAKAAAAGHSLFMPGSKADFEALVKGTADETVSRKQLQINGSRLRALMVRFNKL
ncbi:MAG: glycoside hydrolase family 3 C-terminal domain-containing protein [Oscillospiraceae bacterium]|nr:glycoside hydrolase family 3 C-terminal domain-containing protein [Oscillospiraceae bacterium]